MCKTEAAERNVLKRKRLTTVALEKFEKAMFIRSVALSRNSIKWTIIMEKLFKSIKKLMATKILKLVKIGCIIRSWTGMIPGSYKSKGRSSVHIAK